MSKFYHPFQPTLTQAGLQQLGLSMRASKPREALEGIVNLYLQIKVERQTLYPIMPDGTQAIFISPQGAVIGGAQTEARDVPLLQPGEYFGIWFYPGALRHLFALNLSEITGQFVDKKYFHCHRFSRLHTKIYKYDDFHDRVAVCERWVLERYSSKLSTGFDHALSIIYQTLGSERVGSIAEKVGWSSRHMNRQFLEHTGLSTKAFSQIIRAQALCKQLCLAPSDSTNGAIELGYYDQSHLIKGFKNYFKLTPGEFINKYMSDFYNR